MIIGIAECQLPNTKHDKYDAFCSCSIAPSSVKIVGWEYAGNDSLQTVFMSHQKITKSRCVGLAVDF